MKNKISTRKLALLATFIALSAVIAEYVPGIPIIGVSGASIKLDAALAPIWGLILGPYLGGAAGFIGGVIVASSPFSILTSLSTGISAFITGLLTQKEMKIWNKKINGWIIAAFFLSFLIIGWYLTWVGQKAVLYPFLHIIGLLIIIIGRSKLSDLLEDNDKKKLLIKISLTSYVGIIADHMWGNLSFIFMAETLAPPEIVEQLPTIFMAVAPISAVERILLTIIATVIGISLFTSLKNSGIYLIDKNKQELKNN